MDHNAPGRFPASSLADRSSAGLRFTSLAVKCKLGPVPHKHVCFFCYDLFKVKFMKHCTMLFAVIYLCFLVKLLYKGFGKTNNMY